MKPPICEICSKRFNPFIGEGDTLQFALTENEINKMMEIEKLEVRPVGYTPGLQWFCNKHLKVAKKYVHLTWEEAYPEIKGKTGLLPRLNLLVDKLLDKIIVSRK